MYFDTTYFALAFMFNRETKLAWVKGRAHLNFGLLGRFLL
jgi:hypothetical protein